MTTGFRLISTALAVLIVSGSCSDTSDDPGADGADDQHTNSTDIEGRSPAAGPAASEGAGDASEQAFLAALEERGIAVDSAEAETVVEVGHGICSGLASGSTTEEFDDWLAPLSQSIATRSEGQSSAEVTGTLIGVSRETIC